MVCFWFGQSVMVRVLVKVRAKCDGLGLVWAKRDGLGFGKGKV